MIRKNVVHKIIALAVIAALSLSTTNAFAEEVKNNTAVEQFDAVSDDVHIGDVVDSGNGQSIVIEVDKDGSFKTMDISQNTYALLKCNQAGRKLLIRNTKVQDLARIIIAYVIIKYILLCINVQTRSVLLEELLKQMFPYIMYIKIKDALFVAGKGNREGELMNKTKIIFFSALLMCFSLTTQTEAKNIGEDIYQVCKNDIFTDHSEFNCKKIVTAIDLGEWLKKQNIYDISVVEDNEDTGVKKLLYERNLNKEEKNEFYDSEDTSYIYFDDLVHEGDIIHYTEKIVEEVTEVNGDGSFYTQVEPQPIFLSN